MYKYSVFFALLLFITATCSYAQTNSLLLTTYYPAPAGAYDRLRLVPHTPSLIAADCTADTAGTIYVEDNIPDFPWICLEDASGTPGYGWVPLIGPWVEGAGLVYLANTTLRVGIGTISPQTKLEIVDGELRVRTSTSSPPTLSTLMDTNYSIPRQVGRIAAYAKDSSGTNQDLGAISWFQNGNATSYMSLSVHSGGPKITINDSNNNKISFDKVIELKSLSGSQPACTLGTMYVDGDTNTLCYCDNTATWWPVAPSAGACD